MKHVWIFLCVSLFLQPLTLISAQEKGKFVLSPELFDNTDRSVQIFKNWQYHAGDNLTWAAPTFEDRNWEIVDTVLHPWQHQRPQEGWAGIGWFRLHLEVDEALRNRPLVLVYWQVGASEIYVNGALLYTFGTIGAAAGEEEIDFAIEDNAKIVPITFPHQAQHIIAVRYAHAAMSAYKTPAMWRGFGVVLSDKDVQEARTESAANKRRDTRYQFFFVGALLAFTTLHLMLFYFYPRLKENLYYAFFTGSYTILTFAVFEAGTTTNLTYALVLFTIFKSSVMLVSFFGCWFTYTVFYPTLPKQFRLVATIAVMAAALAWYIPQTLIYLVSIAILAEVLRVILLAFVHKQSGASIIGIGMTLLVVTASYQMLQGIFPNLPQILYFYTYGILASLMSMSLYLARHVAQTNTDLEQRSEELQHLNVELENRVRQRTVALAQANSDLEQSNTTLHRTNSELELRNNFIRRTFGRYLTDEVVENLLQSPEGWTVGGEKRQVTILMSDLRGFSVLAEGLLPEQVVWLLNNYLGAMTDVIMKYEGTIDEFIGDGILVIFGAPLWRQDHAERAVACAVEMQAAIEEVNARNHAAGLPDVEMGIGINTGEVVVGSIGSQKRAKYGVVGSAVNLTGRIESYTVGGQICISEETRRAVADVVKITNRIDVEPKGVKEPMALYEVGGMGGRYNLFLPAAQEELRTLWEPIPIRYAVLEEKFIGRTMFAGRLIKLASKGAEIDSEHPVEPLSNLKIQVIDPDGQALAGELFGKVVGQPSDGQNCFHLRFTSVPQNVATFFRNRIEMGP